MNLEEYSQSCAWCRIDLAVLVIRRGGAGANREERCVTGPGNVGQPEDETENQNDAQAKGRGRSQGQGARRSAPPTALQDPGQRMRLWRRSGRRTVLVLVEIRCAGSWHNCQTLIARDIRAGRQAGRSKQPDAIESAGRLVRSKGLELGLSDGSRR